MVIGSPLNGLEGLRASDQSFDVVGLSLEDHGTVLYGAVEVGDLLVAGGSVGETLDGQGGTVVVELGEALRVLCDGALHRRGGRRGGEGDKKGKKDS